MILNMNNKADNRKYRIIKNPRYGYLRLEPMPKEDKVKRFYQSRYYDLVRKRGRSPELRRLMSIEKIAKQERNWLWATLYSDICFTMRRYASGKRILDVGCGTGDLLFYLKKNGFDVTGIEPSPAATTCVRPKGLNIHNSTFSEFIKKYRKNNILAFDGISFLKVLEHVPNPAEIIKMAKSILRPGGIICIQVPNDFNELQFFAQKQLKAHNWWIAIPDHVNYFNFHSLHSFLKQLGFEIIYSQSDFPMELFLLMDYNYISNEKIGNSCHKKRIKFEMSLTPSLRRSIYESLGKMGIGRNCLVFARLNTKKG